MIVYFIGISLSLVLYLLIAKGRILKKESVLYSKKKISVSRVSFAVFVAAIPLFVIAAFRYMVGTDYYSTYYTGFYRVLIESDADKFEIGYYWLNRVIQFFTDNVFVLFFITSFLFVGIVFKTIEESSINIPLSIILFMFTRYYFVGMNAVRQFIAIAIVTYAIKYVVKQDLLKFALSLLCACLFHYTCVVFVPVYFIAKLDMPKNRLITWTVMDVIIFAFGARFIIQILEGTKYGKLIARYDVAGEKFTIFTIVLNLLILYIAYENYAERCNDIKYKVYFNIQLIAFWVALVLRSIPLMERVYWYYSFPIIISFPYFMAGKEKLKKRIYKNMVLIVFFVYMIYDIAILGDHDVVPYQTVFGKEAIFDSGWIGWSWY